MFGGYLVVAAFTLVALLLLFFDFSVLSGLILIAALAGGAYPFLRWLEKKLTEPIEMVSQIANSISKGDFTQRVGNLSDDTLGQLGESFNRMIDRLKDILRETDSAARHVADTSRDIFRKNQNLQEVFAQVAASTNELATGAGEISENVSSISSSIKDIESKVSNYARSTKEMNERSERTIQLVEKGRSAVEAQSEGMRSNIDATAAVSQTIAELAKQAEGITKITRTISEIAEQTNLLSLNASIEAARAGEHGRGFAVVAQEVRKLAEESAASAKEVFNLVRSIETGIKQAIAKIEENEEVVTRQNELIRETEKVFSEIVDGVKFITEQIHKFAEESDQMLESARSIAASMENISAITQQSAAGTEQVSASMNEQISSVRDMLQQSEQMASMVTKLQKTIQIFKM